MTPACTWHENASWLDSPCLTHLSVIVFSSTDGSLRPVCAFLDQELISYRCTHLDVLLIVLVGVTSSKRLRFRRLQSDRDEIWYGNLLQVHVNAHRLEESDFQFEVIILKWRPWRYFTRKSATAWWVHTQRLPGHVQQRPPVLTYSTFIHNYAVTPWQYSLGLLW